MSLISRVGGPLGGHRGATKGLWFDPAPWVIGTAMLLWLIKMVHQSTCQQHEAGKPVNAMLRMCYSDIPLLHGGSLMAKGGSAFEAGIDRMPVITAVIEIANRLAAVGAQLTSQSAPQTQQNATNLFMVVTSVILFGFFLLLVASHLLMGRNSQARTTSVDDERRSDRPRLSWDAMFIAASLGIFTAGLISWELVPAGLVGFALLMWAQKRVVASGIVLGLACAAASYPWLLLVAVILLCIRAGRHSDAMRMVISTLGSFLLVSMPMAIMAPESLARAYKRSLFPEIGLGSIAKSFQDVWPGLKAQPGAPIVAVVGILAVSALVFVAPRRPRVAQIMALYLIVILVAAPVYSPQYVIILLPFVALARPQLRQWIVFSVVEALYWWAVFAHLQGQLRFGPDGQDRLYFILIYVRVAVQLWIAATIVRDILRPWDDPVRRGWTDDPQGGVLDHTADGRTLLPESDRSEAFLDDENIWHDDTTDEQLKQDTNA